MEPEVMAPLGVLTVNAGSSSIKTAVFEGAGEGLVRVAGAEVMLVLGAAPSGGPPGAWHLDAASPAEGLRSGPLALPGPRTEEHPG